MKLTASSWEKITPLAFRNDVNNSAIQVIDTIQGINSDIMQITKQIQSNDSKEDLN